MSTNRRELNPRGSGFEDSGLKPADHVNIYQSRSHLPLNRCSWGDIAKPSRSAQWDGGKSLWMDPYGQDNFTQLSLRATSIANGPLFVSQGIEIMGTPDG